MLNGLSESQDEGLWFLLGLEGGARISVTSGQHFVVWIFRCCPRRGYLGLAMACSVVG